MHGRVLGAPRRIGVLLLGASAAATANDPPRHEVPLAFRPDLTAPLGRVLRATSPVGPASLPCHQLSVCARLETEVLRERLDNVTPGPFLRLTSGVGLGFRF